MSRAISITLGGVAATVLLMMPYSSLESPWCWLGWVMLVPWLAALDQSRSLRAAFGSALAMNLAFVLVFFGWFIETIRIYTGASLAVAAAVVVLAAPILEPQFFALALVRYLGRARITSPLCGHSLWVSLVGGCAYIGAEWAFPKLFAATLGLGLYGSPWMRQAADISGTAGLTLALLVVNDCVLCIPRSLRGAASWRHRMECAALPMALAILIPTGLLGYGCFRCRQLDRHAPEAPRVRVAAVQANISNYERIAREMGTYEGVRYILAAHYRMSAEAIVRSDPDLVIWPETVYPTTFGSPKSADGAAFDREIARFVAASGRPFIFGSYDAEGEKQFNAAVFIAADRQGRVSYGVYRKAALFPFTERVPGFLDRPLVRARFPWLGTWTAGTPPEPVAVQLPDGRRVRIVPLICYDALVPELPRRAARAGADLIVTLSNDSWFATGIAPRLHLRMAAFRSIETHLPQVRATNTGISAAITASGDITQSLSTGERGVLDVTVPLNGVPDTLMVRCGDWLSPGAAVAAVLWLVASLLSGRRRSFLNVAR